VKVPDWVAPTTVIEILSPEIGLNGRVRVSFWYPATVFPVRVAGANPEVIVSGFTWKSTPGIAEVIMRLLPLAENTIPGIGEAKMIPLKVVATLPANVPVSVVPSTPKERLSPFTMYPGRFKLCCSTRPISLETERMLCEIWVNRPKLRTNGIPAVFAVRVIVSPVRTAEIFWRRFRVLTKLSKSAPVAVPIFWLTSCPEMERARISPEARERGRVIVST
jgi:hypothetical protein